MTRDEAGAPLKRIGDVAYHFPGARKMVRGARSEREELVERFRVRLNGAREKAGFPAIEPIRMSVTLSRYSKKLFALYALYGQCEEAEQSGFGFSKCFWSEMKRVKKPKQLSL